MKIKAILLDVDGVLISDYEIFSDRLEEKYNISYENLMEFFHGGFQDCLTNTRDIREVLPYYFKQWGWDGTVDDFLIEWFESENKPNLKLINFLKKLRKEGYKVKFFLGTNNEKLRVDYILNEMNFKEFVDKTYSSCNLYVKKPSSDFFNKISEDINKNYFPITHSEILYFDDNIDNVESAKQLGFRAYQYKTFKDFEEVIKKYSLE